MLSFLQTSDELQPLGILDTDAIGVSLLTDQRMLVFDADKRNLNWSVASTMVQHLLVFSITINCVRQPRRVGPKK